MAKVDPRAEPVTNPPSTAEGLAVDHLKLPRSAVTAPRIDDAPSAELDAAEPAPPPRAASTVTSSDPRFEPLEKLLDANDWRGVGVELGPMDQAGKLPPNLGLVASIAHNELAREGDPEAVATAIRCMAAVLGVAETSPLARVLARRLLRKNPTRLRDRPAPPARISLLIVIATLVVGGGIGWLASMGGWQVLARMLHL
jgi:hypothetical protein